MAKMPQNQKNQTLTEKPQMPKSIEFKTASVVSKNVSTACYAFRHKIITLPQLIFFLEKDIFHLRLIESTPERVLLEELREYLENISKQSTASASKTLC